ncbi:hypothetical protein BLA24_31350 [Streptomyces cinnamoneus]|uniref:DUF1648 domain-containing protein n=2 Tax=Streptomyces cinnamoneus TaxID=53446 RepID=A0A2G1X9R6_STRCJ|nr:hypothetical protein BLA24_31350 [Streptomyces cinnamoneus]PPT15585.1 hypothetical protein CYQ11_24390 [Streptomyces cinnamoneus]
MATHFSGGGHADGYTALDSFPYEALALLLAPAALFVALGYAMRTARTRALTALACGLAGTLGCVSTSVVLVNAHASTAAEARLPLGHLGLALAVGAAAAGLGLLLAGRDTPSAAPAPAGAGAPRLDLGDGESATWTRVAGSRPLRVVGAVSGVLGVLLAALVGWGAGLGLLATTVLLLPMSTVRVTVDRHGLTACLPWLPRPRLRIPLARVASAQARHVDPWKDLGGWGYRVVPGRSGLALRSGEAIVVALTTGSEFVVTVDDAATAAALLNALADRHRAHGGSRC